MLFLWRGVSNLRENLQSNRQRLKYLIFVPLLVTVALASYKIGQSSSVARKGDAVPIRHRREVTADSERTRNQSTQCSGGATYVRWGRTICPTGTELVYNGVVGGSHYTSTGGGSNYLCLPMQPLWGVYKEAVEKRTKLYGAEYDIPSTLTMDNVDGRPLQDNNVPCAVCRSLTKTSVLMIPARNQCYDGWIPEYVGYLMSGSNAHVGRTEFVCMDRSPEADPSGYRDENGALFYQVEGVCGSLPCPPYFPSREFPCVVCGK